MACVDHSVHVVARIMACAAQAFLLALPGSSQPLSWLFPGPHGLPSGSSMVFPAFLMLIPCLSWPSFWLFPSCVHDVARIMACTPWRACHGVHYGVRPVACIMMRRQAFLLALLGLPSPSYGYFLALMASLLALPWSSRPFLWLLPVPHGLPSGSSLLARMPWHALWRGCRGAHRSWRACLCTHNGVHAVARIMACVLWRALWRA